MIYNLVINVIVVLFLCGVVIWTDLSLSKKYSSYILGVIFGLITIFIMQGRIIVAEGRFLDFRHITLAMAGFIGGPVTAVISAVISAVYRYRVGGSGSLGGIIGIVVFACFGAILGRHFKTKQNGKKLLFWFIIGIVLACIWLVVIVITSLWTSNSVMVFKTIYGPLLIISPLATTIIFNFYFCVYESFGETSILKAIMKSSPMNIVVFGAKTPILLSENMKTELKAYPFIATMFPVLFANKGRPDSTEPQHKEFTTEDGRHFVAEMSSFQLPSGENACIAIINDLTDQRVEQEKLRTAENKFSKVFQLAPHMMAILRKSDYRYVDVNCRFLEAKGFNYVDVIGKTPTEIGVSEIEFIEIIEVIERQGTVRNVECSLDTKYGSIGTAILSAERIQIDDQECILFAYNDITELKQMQSERVEQLTKNFELETKLSQSNQLIADIMTHTQDAFYVLDNQWRFTFVNNKAEELLKKTRAELLGNVLWEINPLTRECLCGTNFQKAWDDCLPITFEVHCVLNKGLWNQVTAYPTQFGLSVYYRDITESKLASDELTKSQKEMVSILESMTDCFYAMDQDLQFTYINHAAEIAFEKSRGQILGKKMTEVFKVNDTALFHYHDVMHNKESATFEILSEALGNKWLEMSVYPVVTGVTCYFRDITSRKLSEEAIRQSEEKFAKAFHGGFIMMVLVAEGGEAIDVNEAFCTGSGYTREEVIGRTSNELNLFVDLNKRRELVKVLKEQGRIENAEIDFRTKSGEIRHGLGWCQILYLDGSKCNITGFIDVTEQKRIQKEMANLDRLNLVGQLAAGIAHEIRNPMTTIRGYLQLLGEKPEYEAQKSTFALMVSEVDRANFIITEFLSLAQTKPTELKSQSLNDIINHVYPLLEADTFTRNKQIYFFPGEIPNLELNKKEILQLIINLARNGLESMAVDGTLTIITCIEGDKVVLEIADEGCGIPPENLNKLGIPFYTTKDDGTGLGLATCYKIAEAHNAKININSSPSGTKIYIIFPIPGKE
ncbi:MAG: PAS domain S-box protein [Desulfosporosinus sp.]|nr:PAS domain S-box protein [Desulfosporosinus sp.]